MSGKLPEVCFSTVICGDLCANDIFWAPVGATTIGANANFIGNIFRGTADGLSITFGDSSTLTGRALAFGSTVTTANTTLVAPNICAGAPTITVFKDYIPNSGSPVSVGLQCTGAGTVDSTPQNASEGSPAVFGNEHSQSDSALILIGKQTVVVPG